MNAPGKVDEGLFRSVMDNAGTQGGCAVPEGDPVPRFALEEALRIAEGFADALREIIEADDLYAAQSVAVDALYCGDSA